MPKQKFKFYAVKLTGILILIFLAQILIPSFTDLFILNSLAFQQLWRFISAIFLHGGLGHLAYNSFALLLFGSILERLVGGRKFLTIFFVSGILANIISINFYNSSLGASGAIFGIIAAIIAIKPLLPVWAFGMPMPILLAGVAWAIGDIIGFIGFLSGNPLDNTGNLAHLSGMFFGFILGILYRKKAKKKKPVELKIDEKHIRNWEDGYLR